MRLVGALDGRAEASRALLDAAEVGVVAGDGRAFAGRGGGHEGAG